MQATWAANLNWDDPLTDKLQQALNTYADDLRNITIVLFKFRGE